jgi:polysaccharide biosynthesis protein PslH
VEDLRPYLWSASVSVVPLRSGGGTRLKILESLAAGCPVVSTIIGAERLILGGGKDLRNADMPETFTRAVIELLKKPGPNRHFYEYGRTAVANQYDWSGSGAQLETFFKFAVEMRFRKR